MRDEHWNEILQRRGAVKRVAEGLGISTAAVAQWPRVPERRVQAVAGILGVQPAELRPDLYAEAAQ